jgi:hypothetical protein
MTSELLKVTPCFGFLLAAEMTPIAVNHCRVKTIATTH